MNDYEKGYFVGGVESNYVDYRLRRFDGLARDLINSLPIRPTDRVLDVGCGTGGLIYSMKRQGIESVHGMDASLWAIQFGRNTFGFGTRQLQYYSLNLLCEDTEWALALDVFEHMPNGELERILTVLGENKPRKGLAVRIPISAKEGEDFVLDVSKNDRTHIQIHERDFWIKTIEQFGFKYERPVKTENIYDSPGVFCGVFK